MEPKIGLESILNEIGYVGRTQSFYFLLICLVTFFTGSFTVIYVFTAGDLNYRCYINECDNSVDYNPEWIKYAMPFDEDTELPEKCLVYIFADVDRNISQESCDASDFNTKHTVPCNNGFVFETNEKTILTEFDLMCKDNKWKLTLVGTIQSSGKFFNMLLVGYFSDRFGRKLVFIASALLESTLGICEIFAPNYWWFLTFTFLETCLGGATYTIALIYGIELVSPEYRTAVGSIIFALASFGTIYLGLAAMLVLNWKTLIMVCYIPNFIAVTYIWLLPESITWLQVKGRYQDMANLLLRIIKWNKIEVSAEARDILINRPETLFDNDVKSDENIKNTVKYPIRIVLQNSAMMLRMLCLAYCWLATLFIFYGLSLISVAVGDNKFTDFIIASAIELPACLLVVLISNRVGRKTIMCGGFFISAASLFIYTFVSHIYWIKMVLFMMGKFAITMSFCTIFIYTSEMVPTNLRQTLVGVCIAVGRIGALTAPQAPLLDVAMKHLSIYLFAVFALIGGLISFRLPETLNSKLPDTIEEALKIGKQDQKKSEVL